jgi:hypothetical protein
VAVLRVVLRMLGVGSTSCAGGAAVSEVGVVSEWGFLEGLVEGWRIAEDVGRWYFGIRYDAAECANVVILLLQYSNATEKKQSTEIP